MKKWNIRTVRRHVSNLLCNLARAGTFNRVPDLLLSDLSDLLLSDKATIDLIEEDPGLLSESRIFFYQIYRGFI